MTSVPIRRLMQFLDGIIFDMDGVLCDSEPFIRDAAMEMFRQTYGKEVKADDFKPFVGAGEDRFIGGVAEKYGIPLTLPRDKERTYAIYLEMIRGHLQPLPGAAQFIADCRRRGLKLAVATSADRIKLEGNLAQIGIPAADFDAVLTGDDVERKKPDPQVFLLAARRLELEPARCLVVEDAANGVRAAVAAGSMCLGITTSFDDAALRACGAAYTAKDLAHVPGELVELFPPASR